MDRKQIAQNETRRILINHRLDDNNQIQKIDDNIATKQEELDKVVSDIESEKNNLSIKPGRLRPELIGQQKEEQSTISKWNANQTKQDDPKIQSEKLVELQDKKDSLEKDIQVLNRSREAFENYKTTT